MNGTTMSWHHAEGITDRWMVIPACLLAGWVACSAYYQVPELLHEHGKLVSIERNRNAITAESLRAIAAERENADRINALMAQFHDMENHLASKAGRKAKR